VVINFCEILVNINMKMIRGTNLTQQL